MAQKWPVNGLEQGNKLFFILTDKLIKKWLFVFFTDNRIFLQVWSYSCIIIELKGQETPLMTMLKTDHCSNIKLLFWKVMIMTQKIKDPLNIQKLQELICLNIKIFFYNFCGLLGPPHGIRLICRKRRFLSF